MQEVHRRVKRPQEEDRRLSPTGRDAETDGLRHPRRADEPRVARQGLRADLEVPGQNRSERKQYQDFIFVFQFSFIEHLQLVG